MRNETESKTNIFGRGVKRVALYSHTLDGIRSAPPKRMRKPLTHWLAYARDRGTMRGVRGGCRGGARHVAGVRVRIRLFRAYGARAGTRT